MSSELSSQDQCRVDAVLARGTYAPNRKPFKPWRLLGGIMLVLMGLSVFSYLIAHSHGVV